MEKCIALDLDGSIADLYAVNGWLEQLRAENPNPYRVARPMWNMTELNAVLIQLQQNGWQIVIITWLSKNSSERYKEEVRTAKREWLAHYNVPFDQFHGVQYGTTKFDCIRKYKPTRAILIDDNAEIRKGWAMESVDPTTTNIIEYLRGLL